MSAQYLTVIFAGLGSMLAGAAVTHQLFKPRLDLEPLDEESQRHVDEYKAYMAEQEQKVMAALQAGDTEEVRRLLAARLAGQQLKCVLNA